MHVSPILYFGLLSVADDCRWENAGDNRVSVACAYDTDKWHFYDEQTIGDLVYQIRIAALAIGFNIKELDYKVLSRYTDLDFTEIPTFDLLEEIYQQLGHHVKLDNLAQATLGIGAADLLQLGEGELDAPRAFCKRNVDITYRLFLAGWQDGYLLYTKDGQEAEINTESWKAKFEGLFLGV